MKEYKLIYMNGTLNKIQVFTYFKSRRFTKRQAFNYIYNNKSDLELEYPLGKGIDYYFDLVDELGYDLKYCDRYPALDDMIKPIKKV